MNRFIVHGIPGSPFSRSVLATLQEKGANYRLAALGVGMLKTEPHLLRHPFGRVPVLESGGAPTIEGEARRAEALESDRLRLGSARWARPRSGSTFAGGDQACL